MQTASVNSADIRARVQKNRIRMSEHGHFKRNVPSVEPVVKKQPAVRPAAGPWDHLSSTERNRRRAAVAAHLGQNADITA